MPRRKPLTRPAVEGAEIVRDAFGDRAAVATGSKPASAGAVE